MNILDILEAWIIAGNPTKIQKELSEKRAEICESCEFKKEIIKGIKLSIKCSKCGCPLAKKIFTNSYNACPMNKWGDVDIPYFNKQKNDKTLF